MSGHIIRTEKSPNIYKGIPTFRVRHRQDLKRQHFKCEVPDTYQTKTTPTTQYGKLTRQQLTKLTKAIQESDVATFNGYATHNQLYGYRDCYLARSIHGTGICLKVHYTLTMVDNAEPKCG